MTDLEKTPQSQAAHPIQPLVHDEHGVLRFKKNPIVRHLLDTHPNCDLNELACMKFSDEDRQQFAQLIGYSLSGYGSLSYVSDASYDAAASTVYACEQGGQLSMELTDKEIMDAMPKQLHEDLAKVCQMASDSIGVDVAGMFRVCLNRGIVDHCRAVIAADRAANTPSPSGNEAT